MLIEIESLPVNQTLGTLSSFFFARKSVNQDWRQRRDVISKSTHDSVSWASQMYADERDRIGSDRVECEHDLQQCREGCDNKRESDPIDMTN